MARKISDVVFELDRIYNSFADQLIVSNSVAGLLHDSVDIKASGNQVEGSLRVLLSELLPKQVNVSQGHIVDVNMAISRQQDIVISENIQSKSIIKTLDGTEFLMYESVYAIGEVKKTLSPNSFSDACVSIKDTKSRLARKQILPNVFSTSPDLITTSQDLTSNPYRNPLFSFLFSVSFKGASISDFKSLLSDKQNWSFLPNVIVVLDEGLFVVIDSTKDSINIKLYPEFEKENDNCKWFFLPFEENQKGRNLAFLIFMLQQHIHDSLLFRPSLLEYASEMIEIDSRNLISI